VIQGSCRAKELREGEQGVNGFCGDPYNELMQKKAHWDLLPIVFLIRSVNSLRILWAEMDIVMPRNSFLLCLVRQIPLPFLDFLFSLSVLIYPITSPLFLQMFPELVRRKAANLFSKRQDIWGARRQSLPVGFGQV
jgi:hypothetical protein